MDSQKIKRDATGSNDRELTEEQLAKVVGGTVYEGMDGMVEGETPVGAFTEN